MDLQLSQACVLVTGGSRGIGRAIALAFAREGARVAICGRDAKALEAAARDLRAAGGHGVTLQADLEAPGGCEDVVARAAEAMGGLTVLVNNASGSVDHSPPKLQDITDHQALARINGKMALALRCSRASVPHMQKAGRGRIIHIGGTSARNVFRPGELPGKGSGLPQGLGNAALASFSKYLAEELLPSNILVNVVHPHVVRTDRHAERVRALVSERGLNETQAEAALGAMFPLGRVIEPDEVAHLVVFLASSRASAITGQAIAVDGGASRNILY